MVQVEERLASPPQPTDGPVVQSAQAIILRWYPLAVAALVVVGFMLRVHRLGERAIHHDESLHALYSWYLYVGRGYVHDPMMHGPWQFHMGALMYFLFGDSDFTARLGNVLFGTAIIAAPYFLRRELGRTGAIAASVLFTISPAFLYFSRFAREDIYFAGWTVLMVVGIFGMIRTHRERYLYLAALGFAGAFATKEAVYITGFIWLSFFGMLLALYRRSDSAALVRSTLRAYPRSAWLKAVALVLAFDGLLFTTFFTNMGDPWNCLLGKKCTPGGLWTGTGGALLYWIDQHSVQRGGQPWFYYLLLLPLYEFVPLILSAASVLVLRTRRNLFSWFCLYWAAGGLLIYSYAGEKMPWIVPHIALPMVYLGAQFLGGWIEGLDLARLRRPASLWVAGLGLLALAVSLAALGLNTVRTLTPLERQSFLLEKLGFVLALAAIAAALVWIRRRRPEALLGAPLAIAGLIALGAFYVHTSWQLSYKNGDVPVEMLVYVQSSPDVPQVVQEIERIAFQTGQGKDLRILMDNGYTETVGGQPVVHEAVSWPFEWYLRDYKNRRYYSKTIGNDINLADYPVALIMGPNLDPARDRLGDYNGQKYRLNWWYPEDYKGLTPQLIWNGLRDPNTRARLLQYLLYRDTLNPLGAREFYFFARKEIPPLGPAATTLRPSPPPPAISTAPRVGLLVQRPDGGAILGRSPDGVPLLSQPKGLAVGPDGRIYVAEAGAHRVTVFNPDGTINATWGRQGNGDGEFQEPWGITVSPSGEVYVADTWNHRIQKFDADGRLLIKWGELADTKGAVNQKQGSFWGPRDLALGPDGLLYVTDTGNKRVEVFEPDGKFVRAFGGEGSEPGLFREPVGLAFDGSTLLVADTWNGRVQRFDPNGRPLGQIPVSAWEGQSVTNKPYLVADPGGRLLISAPDRGTVQVLGPDGTLAETIQPEGQNAGPPGLPTGLARAPTGELYVSDARSGVVYRLPVPR